MRSAALVRLVRSELRGRRLRSMLLFLVVVVLASATMVAGLEGQTKAEDRWDAAFREANGPHVVVFGDPQTLAAVARDARVSDASPAYRIGPADRQLRVASRDAGAVTIREIAGGELPAIARPLLRDGRWADRADEVVIDRAFGIEERVEVGDRVTIDGPSGPVPFTVVGRAVDLVDCFYPNCEPAPTWFVPSGFARVEGSDLTYVSYLRLHDPSETNAFVADLTRRDIGMMDWIDTRDDVLGSTALFTGFLQAFGVFVMIAATVVVAGSMATRAIARRRDIGLLKAVGFTPGQVGGALVLSHALTAAIGVLLGWLLGGVLVTRMQLQIGRTLGGGDPAFTLRGLIITLVAVEAIVVLAVALPAWRAGRVPTTVALATVAPAGHRRSFLAIGAQLLRIGPVGVSGFKDAFARPARSILTAVALAVAVVAVLVTLAVDATIDRVLTEPALAGEPDEVRVFPRDRSEDDTRAAIEATEGVRSWFTETPENLVVRDERVLGVAMGGDLERSGFIVREGRMPDAAGEAAAGHGFLERFGLAVGDTVEVEVGDASIPLRIVGWYREMEDTGEILRFTLDDLRRVKPGAGVTWIGVNTSEADRDRVAASLAAALPGATVTPMVVRTSSEIETFRLAFSLVSLLVILVALANLMSTMLLGVRERVHDLGVLRAVGLTPGQVVAIVAIGAGVLGLTATAIAAPVALMTANAVTEVVGAATGVGPGLGVGPGTVVLTLLLPVTVAVAAAFGAAAAARAARATVSELVRYE